MQKAAFRQVGDLLSVLVPFHTRRMGDSSLREAAARLQEAVRAAAAGEELPYGTARVRIGDLLLLFEALKRYGGRRDWTPVAAAIEALPGPVRRHVAALEAEQARLQRLLIAREDRLRAAERALEQERRPAR